MADIFTYNHGFRSFLSVSYRRSVDQPSSSPLLLGTFGDESSSSGAAHTLKVQTVRSANKRLIKRSPVVILVIMDVVFS